VAQGRQTQALETVGQITGSGTFALVQFAGVVGGISAGIVYLLFRRWLPKAAGPAGLAIGIVLLGTIGVLDPLRPSNIDFDLLKPRWLAVVLVIGTAELLGVSFSALAARLDQLSVSPSPVRLAVYLGLVPMFTAIPLAVVYIGGRVLVRGRVSAWLGQPRRRHFGTMITRIVIGATVATTLLAAGTIMTS
jgi:hypothetical protein